ncbi:MAG: glycine--tRNA ligase subunit beta [Rickettsiales bacterium]|nr:glycine--tRNA ligase subunit beta [Rickettsiales bacterium]
MQNKILLELSFKNLTLDVVRSIRHRLLIILKDALDLHNCKNSVSADVFATPERLAARLSFGEEVAYLYRGLKTDEKSERLEFFLRKTGAKSPADLEIIDDVYYYKKILNGDKFIENFRKNIVSCLENTFSHSPAGKKNPLLELRNILFIANDRRLDIAFNNIKSCGATRFNNDYFEIDSVDRYFELASDNKIFFEVYNRREYVKKQLSGLGCDQENMEQFLENVLSVKEKPLFLMGKIKFKQDNLFINILQRYLKNNYLLFYRDDSLFFVFTADSGKVAPERGGDNETLGVHGHRIEKAANRINNLIKTFETEKRNREYGHIFSENKITRLEKLTKFIAIWIPGCDAKSLSDILSSFVFRTSNLLNNNIELTLLLSKYILLEKNMNKNLVELTIDCFRPFEKSKELPKYPLSNAVAIANKIDNIVYLAIFRELNLRVNRDREKKNYADLVNIILNNQINVSLKIIIDYAIKNFINEIIEKKQDVKFFREYKVDKNNVSNAITTALYNRLYYHLSRGDEKSNAMLSALINIEIRDIYDKKNLKCDLLDDSKKIISLREYLSGAGEDVIKIYRRLNNLLLKYKNAHGMKPISFDSGIRLGAKEENDLRDAYFAIRKEIKFNLKKKDYYQLMISLNKFRDILNNFLDKIFVEKSSFLKKQRRLRLLFSIKYLFDRVANFEKLIIKL